MARECPVCGGEALQRRTGDYVFEWPGCFAKSKSVLHDASWEVCDACGESILPPELSDRIEQTATSMKTISIAALLAVALTGCAMTIPPPAADANPPEARLLAEQRATTKNAVTTGSTQPRPVSKQAALDVDRINKKLATDAPTSAPADCGAREEPAYIDAHATWGDTAQELQRRKACAARRTNSH